MSTTTSKGTGNTTEAGGRVVFEQALFKLLNTPENYVGEMNRNANALRDIYATLSDELAALKASNAALAEALDTYRLTRNAVIAGLPFSWTDVDKVVNAALASVKS